MNDQVLRLAEWLIGRACRNLPDELRDDRYHEWTEELPHIRYDPEIRLAARRALMTLLFAADQSRGARRLRRARVVPPPRAVRVRRGAAGARDRLRPIALGVVVGYFGGGDSGAVGGAVLGVLCVLGGWAFGRLKRQP